MGPPGGLCFDRCCPILGFSGELSDLGTSSSNRIVCSTKLGQWARGIHGTGDITACTLGQPPGQGLMVKNIEECGHFAFVRINEVDTDWRGHSQYQLFTGSLQ